MINYEQTIQTIINSITSFSFEFDSEIIKKEMELQEVSREEIEKLGEVNVREKFNASIFKIKLPGEVFIDANSIVKYSKEHNIKEPVIFINPDFKYVQWVVKKDFLTPQIKRHIKNQLTNNTDIDFAKVKKALVIADIKNREIEGYIGELPIKTSNIISEGTFHIQCSCSIESAIEMISEVNEELTKEKEIYVTSKIKRDHKSIIIYFIFVAFVVVIWLLNNQYQTLPTWLSSTISVVLFLVSLVVIPLINHSFFYTLFSRKKAKKKYEKEFSNKVY
jgi:hypothetical protein